MLLSPDRTPPPFPRYRQPEKIYRRSIDRINEVLAMYSTTVKGIFLIQPEALIEEIGPENNKRDVNLQLCWCFAVERLVALIEHRQYRSYSKFQRFGAMLYIWLEPSTCYKIVLRSKDFYQKLQWNNRNYWWVPLSTASKSKLTTLSTDIEGGHIKLSQHEVTLAN